MKEKYFVHVLCEITCINCLFTLMIEFLLNMDKTLGFKPW